MANILVTDGNQRSSLAVARSLGAAGHSVYVCSPVARSLAGISRYATAHAHVASALEEPRRYVRDVRALVSRWRIAVLLPVTEESAYAILGAEGAFRNVIIPMPPYRSFVRICEKPRALEAAEKLGIRIPRQTILRTKPTPADVRATVRGLTFPLVVKPATSVVADGNRRAKLDVRHATNRSRLLRALEAMPDEAFPVMLQERIQGPGVGVFLLLWNSEVIASFAHRRLRETQLTGGASVDRESIDIDPDLLEKSVALLRAFNWRGVAMVEYKVDRNTGTPVLMEVNGRFWGSLQLAIDAGVDFPALLVNAALGDPGTPVTTYRAGVRSRWFWGDFDRLLKQLRIPSSKPHGTGKLRSLAHFLSASWQARNEVMRPTDPAPGLLESWQWVRTRGRHAYRKLAQKLGSQSQQQG
jgi:predicted ATP-grasp superfamily ATP-dependent carboligase